MMYKIKLSPYHKIFYNEWKLYPNVNYNITFDQTFPLSLDLTRLKAALHRFVSDYVLFNSHIIETEDELFWVKNDKIQPLDIFAHYSSHRLQKYVTKQFNLNTGQLYRFGVFKHKNRYRLIIVFHHILIDGSSFDKLIEEISKYYNNSTYRINIGSSKQINLITQAVNNTYQKLDVNNIMGNDFWHSKLLDIEPVNLRFIKLNSSIQLQQDTINYTKELFFNFGEGILNKLTALKFGYGLSVYLYSQIVFALLLYRYTSQAKFAICCPIKIKDYADLIYGAGVNTNPCLYNINRHTTIDDLITESKHKFINNLKPNPYNKAYYPVHDIITHTNREILEVFFAQTNLKNTRFNFIDADVIKINKNSNLDLAAKLQFEQEIKGNSLKFSVRYNSLEIDQVILKQFIRHYKKLFLNVLNDLNRGITNKNISSYSILSIGEYKNIVYDQNRTKKYSTNYHTLNTSFEKQASETPDNIAIIYKDKKYTYKELNNKANQIANYLNRKYNFNPEDFVVLCLDRSDYLILAMLAVLKIGSAYVPINPSYPIERINYILGDTQAQLILTNLMYRKKIEKIITKKVHHEILTNKTIGLRDEGFEKIDKMKIIALDDEKIQSKIDIQNATNPKPKINSNNLAYVIYTSGTTGTPKGVMIEHKSVVSLAKDIDQISISSNDCFMQLADVAFDAITFEVWGALLNGAKLYIPNDLLHLLSNLAMMQDLIAYHKVSILWLTKTIFDQLYLQNSQLFYRLQYLIVGGEALNYNLVKELITSRYRPKYLINGYGPTENTVFSCMLEITPDVLSKVISVPIGKPLTNKTAYVLDNNLKPLPFGAIGELYVGGVGVARGYLHHSSLTKENFIQNPFQTQEEKSLEINNKLYSSGDLVRILPSGNIEYIGRKDTQVKIRGYRIELSEIENKLLSYDNIKQAVVIVKDSIDSTNTKTEIKSLVGYYVLNNVNDSQNSQDHVSLWQQMYKEVYKRLDSKTFKNNFIGWNSSYSGLPIDTEHMHEWLNDIISKIRSLCPVNILEIGSGSGLILFNLVNYCKHYYATDFSNEAITYLEKIVNTQDLDNKVKLFVCMADCLPYKHITQPVDTVVINSVTQYFPDILYLEQIIKTSIINLNGLSNIVIGDIRDHRLFDVFYHSTLLYRNGTVTLREIELHKKRDKELLISPLYFFQLQKLLPQISNIEVLAKECSFENEMSKFRYDVILHITTDKKRYLSKAQYSLKYSESISIEENLEQYIKNNSGHDYIFIRYPNKNVFNDYQKYEAFIAGKKALHTQTNFLTINQIKKIASACNFRAKFYLDIHNCDYLIVICYKSNINNANFNIIYDITDLHLFNLSNNPSKIAKMLDSSLSNEIKHYLSQQLPSFMVPETLIHLDSLPLTPSGKLDRLSLPEPDFIINEDYIAPKSNLEVKICSIFAGILGLQEKQIGINHDFFKSGGNSILAIRLAAKLQRDFKISINDIFKLRTPAKIIEFAPFVKGNLRQKLDQVKLLYREKNRQLIDNNKEMLVKHSKYIAKSKRVYFIDQCKPIKCVLLTGATGHLGCNVLNQLLLETNYKIYLLVRANSEEYAYKRISKKFKYYFDIELEKYRNRVIILSGDIEKANLNLSVEQYQDLIINIDSIIHCAALVKHYGYYEEFYKANVNATVNLLELAKRTTLKDFHYISTIGIFMEGYVADYNYYIFTENDNADLLKNFNSFYLKTKHIGELKVQEYRKYGVNGNIYRVGNLSANSKNYRNQENLENNGFFQRIKTMLSFGIIAKELSMVEISPVDYTALAVVKIFNQSYLSNETYHVLNPNICDLTKLFSMYKLCVKTLPIEEFIDNILSKLDSDNKQIELFMLHQRWLDDFNLEHITKIEVLQNKTNLILAKLGFHWPQITKEILFDIVQKSFLKDIEYEQKAQNI